MVISNTNPDLFWDEETLICKLFGFRIIKQKSCDKYRNA
jgi:hypothetical protein